MQLGTLLILLFLGLSLCVRSAAATQTSKVHVSAPSRSLTWFPAQLTREKGFYRAERLDVDFVVMKPQVALQALIAGDVGYTTALGSTMRAGVRGLPPRVVMTIRRQTAFRADGSAGNQLSGGIERKATWGFVLKNLGFSFCAGDLELRTWQ